MIHALRQLPMSDRRRFRGALLALATAAVLLTSMSHAQDIPPPAEDRPTSRPTDVRGGGERDLVPENPPEITPAIRASIDKGLRFLVSSQNRDGSWRTNGGAGGYPTAMTALAGLALIAAGNTPTQGAYAKNVSSAVTYMLRTARRDGLIAQDEELSHCMHGHGFATLFLAECYGMEEDPQRQAQIRLVLQRAVELTAQSQSRPGGGWLYTPNANADEGSVTVTQVQALRACRNAGIAVPKKVIDTAMKYLEKSQNPDGGIRYQQSDGGPSRPAITAAAVACYYNAGIYDDDKVKKAFNYCEQQLRPTHTPEGFFGHYYYAHLYMAQVMYMAGDAKWQAYYSSMRDILLKKQADDGSWDGDHVGSTYGTAVALIILQLPYKNLPIVQR